MAQSLFSLSEFRQTVLRQGVARPNRFEVFFRYPGATSKQNNLVNLFCEEASFPPMNIQTKAFKIFGPSHQMPISVEYAGEGLALTFIIDSNMTVKKIFDSWMHRVVNPGAFTVNYRANYVQNMIINQLNEKNEVTYSLKVVDAFPRNINLIPLSQASMNSVEKLTVIFAYRYWETNSISNSPEGVTPNLQAVNYDYYSPLDKTAPKPQFNTDPINYEMFDPNIPTPQGPAPARKFNSEPSNFISSP